MVSTSDAVLAAQDVEHQQKAKRDGSEVQRREKVCKLLLVIACIEGALHRAAQLLQRMYIT